MKMLFLGYFVALFAPLGVALSLGTAPIEEPMPKLPRDIYVSGTIDDNLASSVHFQIKMLNEESGEDIVMHITSGGGSVYSSLRIYDDMMESKANVNTVCEGYCMSMAAVLLAAGSHREASENTVIMLHEVSFGSQGKITEVENQLAEAKRVQAAIDTIIHDHTGLTFQQIKKIEAYDHYMSSAEAKELGLIDAIKEHKKK